MLPKVLGLVSILAAIGQISSSVLTHKEALRELEAGGVIVSGYCTNSTDVLCTSLEGIRGDTVNGLIRLKKLSGCDVVVTGGVETALKEEETDPLSHKKGFWAAVAGNRCVDKYILTSMKCEHKYTTNNEYEYLLCEDSLSNFYSFMEKRWNILFAAVDGDTNVDLGDNRKDPSFGI